jgi:hypothetical protein
MNRKLLYITFGNTGGGGKSKLARIAHFFAECTGMTTQIVDADPGNRSVSQIITSSDAIVFGAKASVGAEIVEVHREIDVLIIDCGANSSTDTYDIVPLLKAANMAARQQGRHTVGLVPVSPNKPGAVGAARAAKTAFDEAEINVHVVLNDVDGSKNFVLDEHGEIDGVPLPHLSPGIVSVLNSEKRSFREMLSTPPADHSRAMDYAARWLEQCAATRAFAPYFDFGADGLNLGRDQPSPNHFVIAKPNYATDRQLKLNEHAAACRSLFLTTTPDSPAFAEVAERYRQAVIDYASS